MSKYTIDYFKEKGIEFFEEMPKDWVICKGAMTQPIGYVWICNNKSFFDGSRKHGLLKVSK